MLYLSKDKLEEIKKKYSTLLVLDSDVAEAFDFVWEVMIAEIDAIKKKQPHANKTVDSLGHSAYELYELGVDVRNENFSDDS